MRTMMLSVLAVVQFAAAPSAQIAADFAAVPSAGTEALTVQFVNASSPPGFAWLWTFGDGTGSQEFEPVHLYEKPGSYTVSLFVIGAGTASVTKVGAVQVAPAELEPQIAASSTQGTVPLTVTFSDAGPNAHAQQWLWDFGDGHASTEPAPAHTYWQPGSYDVTLATAAGTASASTSARSLVHVVPPAVMKPGFEAEPLWGSIPLSVSFHYAGAGPQPETFAWDFGDGAHSTERDPVHVYTTSGPFDVSVTTTLGDVTEGHLAPSFVHVNALQHAFAEPQFYPGVPTNPFALEDVTADGHLDVLSLTSVPASALQVHRGSADGTLGAAQIHPALGGEFVDVVTGDLDQDGIVDVAALNSMSVGRDDMALESLLSQGDGTFSSAGSQPLSGGTYFPTPIPMLGDFTGDGALDLLVLRDDRLTVHPGDGAGGWLDALPDQPVIPFAGLFDQRGTVVDFDLDGRLDVVARYRGAVGTGWAMLRGDGAGGFETSCGAFLSDALVEPLVGDVDWDGFPDVVAAWPTALCLDPGAPPGSTLLQVAAWDEGCSGWDLCQGISHALSTCDPFLIALSDMDGVLGDDIVASCNGQAVVMLALGGGLMGDPMPLPGVLVPRLVGDMDGNGRPDFVGRLGDGTLWVSLNLTPSFGWTDLGGGLSGSSGTPVLTGSHAAAPGDLVRLELADAAPSAPAWLVIGLSQGATPFHGGVLVPSPDLLLPFVTDPAGGAALEGRLPDALGPGAQTWWQAWIADAGGAAGASASNALRLVLPTSAP